MEGTISLRHLQEQAWAQLTLLEECRRRAVAADNPALCSAWVGLFVQRCGALTETAFAYGSLEKIVRLEPALALCSPICACRSCQHCPKRTTAPTPCRIPQNNSRRKSQSGQRFGRAACEAGEV
jgi:hypothetical protein